MQEFLLKTLPALIGKSHSHMNSSIDLRLTFWYVCTGTLTCVQQFHLLCAQCVVCAKNTLGCGISGRDRFPFIYFRFTAMYF